MYAVSAGGARARCPRVPRVRCRSWSQRCLDRDHTVAAWPLSADWIDVGTPGDLARAKGQLVSTHEQAADSGEAVSGAHRAGHRGRRLHRHPRGRGGCSPRAASVRAFCLYTRAGQPAAGWRSHRAVRAGARRRPRRGGAGRHPRPRARDRAVEGVDVVLHLAALIAIPYSYVAPQSYVDTNVTGTLNVLEAVRRHGTPRMVQHLDLGGLRHPRAPCRSPRATRCAGSRRTAATKIARRQAVRVVRPVVRHAGGDACGRSTPTVRASPRAR